MKIEYLGHSCFKLTESTGTSVICDPYYETIGYSMPPEECNTVTISHNHPGHNNSASVLGNPMIINKPCYLENNGITVTAIKSFHDVKKGKKKGENLICKFRMDGMDICHLGDIGHECDYELIEQLLPVNVLIIPVGGRNTIDAHMAYDYVEKLMPDIVIPMHYKTKSLNMDIDKIHMFLDMFEDNQIQTLNNYEIVLNRTDLDKSETKVIVLKRKKQEED